jgi:erythromycin esterase-like protein
VRPSLEGSVERLLHDAGGQGARFLLLLEEGVADAGLRAALRTPLLERAIGVVYRPRTERMSHYFDVTLSEQFDAVIHLDETRAVEPLERNPAWDEGEVPETYPSGI